MTDTNTAAPWWAYRRAVDPLVAQALESAPGVRPLHWWVSAAVELPTRATVAEFDAHRLGGVEAMPWKQLRGQVLVRGSGRYVQQPQWLWPSTPMFSGVSPCPNVDHQDYDPSWAPGYSQHLQGDPS